MLIDECDEVYFSNIVWFERVMKLATIIGFTASPPTQQEEFELLLLNRFFSNNILESELALKLQEGEKEPHIAEPILIEETSVITK